MLRRELFCRKPQLVGGGGDRSGGGGTPSARARGGSPSPRPPPLPQRAFIRRMERCGNAVAFLRRPSPGTTPPARRLLSCRRRYPPCPSALSCRPSGRVTPSTHATVAAMARARRRSRTPAGRTERRSRRGHHPAETAGKVRADAHATRGGQGTVQLKGRLSRSRKKGSTGVQGV